MADVYDAAYSPDLRLAKRKGAVAMVHYPIRSYARTSAQPRAIRAAGMGVIINPEGMANELVGASREKGRNFAQETLRALDPAVPRNGSVAIYASVDTAVYGAPYSDCDEAFRGLNDVWRPAGFQVRTYAEGAVIHHLLGQGLVQGKQWLSMSESFPGFDARSPDICLVQMHDGNGHWVGTDIPGTDSDHITTNPRDIGAWWNDGSPYASSIDPLEVIMSWYANKAEFEKAVSAAAADGVWSRRWTDPTDPTGKRNYNAAQYVLGAWRSSGLSATRASDALKALSAQTQQILNLSTSVTNYARSTAVDAQAVAVKIQEELTKLISGGTPPAAKAEEPSA